MYARFTLAALVILIGLTGAAQAQMLAAGPVYGGAGSVGGTVTCRLFNFGFSEVTIDVHQIFNNVGEKVELASDTCNVPLSSTRSCAFSAPIQGNFAFSCLVRVDSDRVSGVAEIQNKINAVLTTVPLQE